MNAIAVHNLGKKYKLFTSQGGRFLEYLSMRKITRHVDFWALRDISFEIPRGTTLGILGQNGSGKSTLLSILAGVLESSEGSFEINGKVSAILELGSGFHPEFSGRDNIYMYGSIMGLSKEEIDERFDEIIHFSELGDFIDQPLRTYSSGMIVRLAFSVAVNVNADILIVDEALAVGDAIFQHRCFRKIREMQAAGKTILYVGHDTEAVRSLCNSALLLDGGRIIERGDPNYVVNKYYALIAERERAYNEGRLIEHGEIPIEGYDTEFNFVEHLNDAHIICQNPKNVRELTVEVQSTPRKVIFVHEPSEISYTVKVESGSTLAFAIGILPEAWNMTPQGVKFDINIKSDGEKETIFSRVLQPKRNLGDRGWHNFIIPIEKFSGKETSISFNTSSSSEDMSHYWAAWGWAQMINPIQSFASSNPLKAGDIIINKDIENEMPELSNSKVRIGNKKAIITKVEVRDKSGKERMTFQSGEIVEITINILFTQTIEKDLSVGYIIKGKYCDIFGTNTRWEGINLGLMTIGDTITVRFSQRVNFANGLYSATTSCAIVHSEGDIEVLDKCYDCVFFRVNSSKKMAGIIDLDARVTIDS